MAIMVKLKHLDDMKDGTFRFRRRYPKDLEQVLGKAPMQQRLKFREGDALVREHAALVAEYEKRVAEARGQLAGVAGKSQRDQWLEKARYGDHLVDSVCGPDSEDERRSIIAEELVRTNADRELYMAVVNRNQGPPKVTLLDAKNVYLKLNVSADDRQGRQLVDRVVRRLAKFWGPIDGVALEDITREGVRNLQADFLADTTDAGKALAPSTVKREFRCISSMITVCLKEYGLSKTVENHFRGLTLPKDVEEEKSSEKRVALPEEVVSGMRKRLKDNVRSPAQGHVWALLEGTGCRLAEVTGLTIADVVLDHEVPHLDIRPNNIRKLKTKVSVRKVPLVGAALVAAREAVEAQSGSGAGNPLFPSYGKPRGSDAASQALMKHMRLLTKDKKHTVHSLRHRMKDRLRATDAQHVVQNMVLGHSLGGVGEDYGSPQVRLRLCRDALLMVVA